MFSRTCFTHTRQAAQDDVIRDAAIGHGAAAARTAALACMCTSCLRGRALACGGRGGGACVYAAAVLLRVAHIEFDTALANVCVCFASAPPRRMTHTGSTFSAVADFSSTCITHTRQAAQDDDS